MDAQTEEALTHLRVQSPVAALHLPEAQSALEVHAVPSGLSAAALGRQLREARSHAPERQSASAVQAAPLPAGWLSEVVRDVHWRLTRLQMPEWHSLFRAQDAPSGARAAARREHRPVAALQTPESQSSFLAQATPSGACADTLPGPPIPQPTATRRAGSFAKAIRERRGRRNLAASKQSVPSPEIPLRRHIMIVRPAKPWRAHASTQIPASAEVDWVELFTRPNKGAELRVAGSRKRALDPPTPVRTSMHARKKTHSCQSRRKALSSPSRAPAQ